MEKERNREKGNSGRCTKQRSKKKYSKRRTPNKGKFKPKVVVAAEEETITTNVVDNIDESENVGAASTVSAAKVVDVEHAEESLPASGFRLIDLSILLNVFSLLACPSCFSTNTFELNDICERKKGLARYFQIKCNGCLFIHEFYTSPEVSLSKDERRSKGMKTMEINARAVYGCRSIGVGLTPLAKLCGYLNMPSPMTKTSYEHMSNKIKKAAKVVAERSMDDAAISLRGDEETADVGVSVDGTWQRKGYSSTLGVVTAISIDTGKVLDVAILSKSCKGCTSMNRIAKSDPERHAAWLLLHKCNLNYTGSSPGMESAGTVKIFSRSKDKHGLYYTSFYGDGDSKAYAAVQNIYGEDKTVTKYECIGHYQKRIGSRLRKLKKNTKGLGGKGRLTDVKIDTLQNYFGIALRQNVGNLEAMRTACIASMYHVAGYHDTCPKTTDTWCQFQKDVLNDTNCYKTKGGLPVDVRKAILPIYTALCKPEMLEKCLHGKTQNANESFNGMIWNRIPKSTHVGIEILSLGVYTAIANFNYGEQAALDTMKMLNINPGVHMTKSCGVVNSLRKRLSTYKMSEPRKKRRRILRHLKKKVQDKNIDKEGPSYEAGGF